MKKNIILILFFSLFTVTFFSIPNILAFNDMLTIPNSLTLDNNENRLYAGYSNGKISVWNIATGKMLEMGVSKADLSPILSSTISSDGKILAIGRKDGQIEIWSVNPFNVYGEFIRENNSVWAMEFEDGDKYLLTGNADGRLRRWNVDTKNLENIYTRHRRTINSARFSSDKKYLVTGSSDNTVILWDVERGEILEELLGHSGWVTSLSFSPNSKFLLTGSTDKTVKVWAIPRGYQLRNLGPFNSEVWSVEFVSENMAVIGEASGALSLWNVETAKEIRRIDDAHMGAIRVICFADKSRQVFTGSNDGTIKMWDANNLNLISTFIMSDDGEWISYMPLGKYTSSLNAITRNDFYVLDNEKSYTFDEYKDFLVEVDYLPIGDIYGPKITLENSILTPKETVLRLEITDDAAVEKVEENGIIYNYNDKTVNLGINFDIDDRESSIVEIKAIDTFGNVSMNSYEIIFEGFRFYMKEDFNTLKKNSLVILKSIIDGKFLVKYKDVELLVPKDLLVMTPYAPDISLVIISPDDMVYNRTDSDSIILKASLSDILGIINVTLNKDQKIDFSDPVKDFSFEQEFPLNFGDNVFSVSANNIENISKESSLTVTRVERNPPEIIMPLLPEKVFSDYYQLNFLVRDDFMVKKVSISNTDISVNKKEKEIAFELPVVLGKNTYSISASDFFTNTTEINFELNGVRKMYSLLDSVPVYDSNGNRVGFIMMGEEVLAKNKSGNQYLVDTENQNDVYVDWKSLNKVPPDLYKPGLVNLSAKMEGDFVLVKGIAYDDIKVEGIDVSGNRVKNMKNTTISISGYPVRDAKYFEFLIKITNEEIKPINIIVADSDQNVYEKTIFPEM